MAAYSSIDDLQEAFIKIGEPSWELYSGKPKTKPTGATANRTLIAKSSPGNSVEMSWDELSGWLQGIAYGGGNAVVFLDNGQALDIILSKRLREDYAPGNNTTGLAGFQMGNNQLFELWKQNYELQRQIQDLQQPSGTAWEQVGNRILESIDFDKIVPILTTLLQGRPTQVQPVQVSGEQAEQQTEPGPDIQSDMTKNLHDLMGSIETHFNGDQEAMSRFFKGMNETIKNNPSVLNSL